MATAPATKSELEELIKTSQSEDVKRIARARIQEMELAEKASGGDQLAQSLLILKQAIDTAKRTAPKSNPQSAGVSKDELKALLAEMKKGTKISVDDLDEGLRSKFTQVQQTSLTLSTPFGSHVMAGKLTQEEIERPLFQRMLSDLKARNNVYLFGGAGTGKTFSANQLAVYLGWSYIELNCNQFTSPLDILGGQTVEGYQRGKLEMAWGNVDKDGNPLVGVVLCLDELPKIDPNTAGILNGALAKIKEFKYGTPTIQNGRGEYIELKNCFIIATGNTKLNETSVEYEANFKQDLSLQDRFAGSTYEVVVDYKSEFNSIMKDYAFIWLYMTKLREVIIEKKWTGFAFVSIRIMENMRETYKAFRANNGELASPKTLKSALDSFINLFKPNQISLLKQESNYNEFLRTVENKNRIDFAKGEAYNTKDELIKVDGLIRKNQEESARKIA